jgi:hypothetical protein
MGFGLVITFVELLQVTTSNYNRFTNLHNLQFIIVRTKSFTSSLRVATQRFSTSELLLLLRHSQGTTASQQPQSESELLYDWRFTANQFVSAPSLLRQLNTSRHSLYVASSLTGGWVCLL